MLSFLIPILMVILTGCSSAKQSADASSSAQTNTTEASPTAMQDPRTAQKLPAGDLQGIPLFWTDPKAGNLDTAGKDSVLRQLIMQERAGKGPLGGKIPSTEFSFFRLENPSAISIALLLNMGYPILALNKLHGRINNVDALGIPSSTSAGIVRHVMTNLHWVLLSDPQVDRAGGLGGRFKIQFQFGKLGTSTFDGHEPILNRPFSVRNINSDFHVNYHGGQTEAPDFLRTISEVYLAGAPKATAKDIYKQLENEYDKMKLDLSYKVPELIPVQGL